MKLREYLRKKGVRPEALAMELGVGRLAIYRYLNGGQRPREQVMIEIYRWSRGAVMPNDFYDLPDLAPASVAADEVAA